jgi:hypothetical protein
MGKKRDPYGVTPAYLAWKRKGSPGVFDREKDRQVPVEGGSGAVRGGRGGADGAVQTASPERTF